ncbi:hypothetical protein LTR27_004102 [Elasticomyces elasticus]|nr:hypothetical protein LTR27_004102 [Elasticomyces elasticus]
MTIRTANMDDSPLSKIPAELRIYISELALYRPNGVHVDLYTRSILPAALLALAATCKQMRAETHDMLFAINSFTIHTQYFSGVSLDMDLWHDDKLKRAYRMNVQDRLLALVRGPNPMLRHTMDLEISLGEISVHGDMTLIGRALELALDRLIDPCRTEGLSCTRLLRVSFVVRMSEVTWVDDYTVPYTFRHGRDRSATAADLQQCFDKAESGRRVRQQVRAVWAPNDLARIHAAVCAAVFERSAWSPRRTSGFDDDSDPIQSSNPGASGSSPA